MKGTKGGGEGDRDGKWVHKEFQKSKKKVVFQDPQNDNDIDIDQQEQEQEQEQEQDKHTNNNNNNNNNNNIKNVKMSDNMMRLISILKIGNNQASQQQSNVDLQDLVGS